MAGASIVAASAGQRGFRFLKILLLLIYEFMLDLLGCFAQRRLHIFRIFAAAVRMPKHFAQTATQRIVNHQRLDPVRVDAQKHEWISIGRHAEESFERMQAHRSLSLLRGSPIPAHRNWGPWPAVAGTTAA